jgi:hypothetical protein
MQKQSDLINDLKILAHQRAAASCPSTNDASFSEQLNLGAVPVVLESVGSNPWRGQGEAGLVFHFRSAASASARVNRIQLTAAQITQASSDLGDADASNAVIAWNKIQFGAAQVFLAAFNAASRSRSREGQAEIGVPTMMVSQFQSGHVDDAALQRFMAGHVVLDIAA